MGHSVVMPTRSANHRVFGEGTRDRVPSQSLPVGPVICQAIRAFAAQVQSAKTLLGRVGLALGLSLGTLACTLVGIVAIAMAAIMQIVVCPILMARQRRVGESASSMLRALSQESLAVGMAISTACIKATRPDLTLNPDAPLVILIHGYAHSGAAWSYYQGELHKRGILAVALDWGHPLQSLEAATDRIKAELDRMGVGQRLVLAVGHSTGGVIAQRLLQEGKVHGIVALGAPLAGTPLAVLAPGRCMREMQVGSEVLRRVNEDHNVRDKPRCLVRATADLLVPPDSALLIAEQPDAITREPKGADGGHLSLLYSPRVLHIIEQQARDLQDQPGSSI
jgi:pimeloyl-ACP methyl ester carboxylesterase